MLALISDLPPRARHVRSVFARCSAQKQPKVNLSAGKSKKVSCHTKFVSAGQSKGRSTSFIQKSLLCSMPIFNGLSTSIRGLHTHDKDTRSELEASEEENAEEGLDDELEATDEENDCEDNEGEPEVSERDSSSGYTNKLGEETVLNKSKLPQGFDFVPAGNVFVTRRCRQLAAKRYAVLQLQNSGYPPVHLGLGVPDEIAQKAYSDFEAARARTRQKFLRMLDRRYP